MDIVSQIFITFYFNENRKLHETNNSSICLPLFALVCMGISLHSHRDLQIGLDECSIDKFDWFRCSAEMSTSLFLDWFQGLVITDAIKQFGKQRTRVLLLRYLSSSENERNMT